jgi:hypothetical protein
MITKLETLKGVRHKNSVDNEYFQMIKLESKQMRYILKEFFNLYDDDYVCYYCKNKLTPTEIGGIMPSDDDVPIILCNSIICMVEYYDEYLKDGE